MQWIALIAFLEAYRIRSVVRPIVHHRNSLVSVSIPIVPIINTSGHSDETFGNSGSQSWHVRISLHHLQKSNGCLTKIPKLSISWVNKRKEPEVNRKWFEYCWVYFLEAFKRNFRFHLVHLTELKNLVTLSMTYPYDMGVTFCLVSQKYQGKKNQECKGFHV